VLCATSPRACSASRFSVFAALLTSATRFRRRCIASSFCVCVYASTEIRCRAINRFISAVSTAFGGGGMSAPAATALAALSYFASLAALGALAALLPWRTAARVALAGSVDPKWPLACLLCPISLPSCNLPNSLPSCRSNCSSLMCIASRHCPQSSLATAAIMCAPPHESR
jgi:hypothetical protein